MGVGIGQREVAITHNPIAMKLPWAPDNLAIRHLLLCWMVGRLVHFVTAL